MNVLSLCSGIGGLDLGVKLAAHEARTICYVEGESFCQAILLARMADGVLDRAPIWGDLRAFDARGWRGVVDCVIAGFPCQPFSAAGRRQGDADTRNLWPDIRRIIVESEPARIFLENVPGALPYFYHVVLPELSELGYTVATGLFTAAEVGAPHKRRRLYILAHYDGTRRSDAERCAGQTKSTWGKESLANDAQPWVPGWSSESNVGRVAHGVPYRVDRLKALGNAVVPAAAALAWQTLTTARSAGKGEG